MTVTLTAEQEQFVAEQLKTGHYQSASDVVARLTEVRFGTVRSVPSRY